ncbi:LysR family transcriptional regulator [Rhizobium sp. TH135]|uniref:LysR family transcriptional regulator n=1 Tax=Rhizobium sp. TH135 TaxID=2067451 RepID=UPI000C7BC3AD|nr:LysR family transcriptional regulator [Rhizobium sp. TH135]PLK73143.1 LysR family transcriptional regulator [Rhizobium sp. TH135]
MRHDELGDLIVFLTVAEERSFTRAAARLNTSQSALSQTVRRLEERLGIRLLNRSTRNVSPSEAGEELVATLRPAIADIDAQLAALSRFREKPAGLVRITAGQHAADTILWPAVERILPLYPDIKIELSIDSALTNIVEERFDAGIRLGEQLAKDMIAVRVGPDMRMAVVATPAYLEAHGRPETPNDLTQHSCINIRLPSAGGLYVWEFEKDGHEVNVRVDGQFLVNDMYTNVRAAEAGIGMAITMEDLVRRQLEEGSLKRVLDDWCPPFSGYHIYYPSRRQQSPAFEVLLKTLRHRPNV